MTSTSIFDDPTLKEKFQKNNVDSKKLKALDNYSEVAEFGHKNYLDLIKHCMDCGFLGQEETAFLGFMLEKYKVNFLDWAYKTNWLKEEMMFRKASSKKPVMEQMDLFENRLIRLPTDYSVPFELLAQQQKQMRATI